MSSAIPRPSSVDGDAVDLLGRAHRGDLSARRHRGRNARPRRRLRPWRCFFSRSQAGRPSGSVLGIDRSEDAVRKASARAAEHGLGWCRFAVADVETFATDERFDAIVGRLVLMYLKDPARTLRSLIRHLRPGGIVAFHEIILNSMLCVPAVP